MDEVLLPLADQDRLRELIGRLGGARRSGEERQRRGEKGETAIALHG